MKKLIYISIVTLLATTIVTSAQQINWGAEYKDSTNAPIHKIIGSDASGFYLTRFINPRPDRPDYAPFIILEKYDLSGNRIYKKNLTVKAAEGKDNLCDDIFFLKDNMLLSMYLPDTKNANLYKVNKDGSIDKNKLELGDIDKNASEGKNDLERNRYKFSPSADKTTLLAYYHQNKKNVVNIKAVKEDLTVFWSKDAVFPLTGDFSVAEAIMNGTKAYFLTVERKEKEKLECALVMVDNNGGIKKTPLSPEGVECISSYSFKLDSIGDIVFSGLYQSKMPSNISFSNWAPVGYFVMRINGNSGQITMNKAVAFDKDLILKYRTEKSLDKGIGNNAGALAIKNVIENPDKSLLMIGEIYSKEASTSTSYISNGSISNMPANGGAMAINNSAVDYMYNDVVLFKINSDGSQAWCQNITKKQESDFDWSASKGTFSFGYYIAGNTMHILYNDDKKNALLSPEQMEKQKDDIKTAKFGSLELISETVNLSNGNLERAILGHEYDGDKEKSNIYVADCFHAGNKIIIYRHSPKKKAAQFGQLAID